MAATIPSTPISGSLVVTPDPNNPSVVLSIMRDPRSSQGGIFYSKDGGKTFVCLLPIPGDRDEIFASLMLDAGKKGGWKKNLPGASVVTPVVNVSGGGLVFVQETYSNALVLNDIFGFFQVPAGYSYSLVALQASLQNYSDGGVTIDILDATNTLQGKTLMINPGQNYGSRQLSSPLLMGSGSTWRFQILNCGSNAQPGEQMQVRLVLTPN